MVCNLDTMATYPRWRDQWLMSESLTYRMLNSDPSLIKLETLSGQLSVSLSN